LFYGEEIGMAENLEVEDRMAVRTPMQWTGDESAGFSSAPADGLVRPLPSDKRFSAHAVNVRDQRIDPDSLLTWFETLIRLRKESPEVGWGDCRVLATEPDAVLALRYDWSGRTVITVHNLGKRARTVELPIEDADECVLRDLLRGENGPVSVRGGVAKVKLAPHGYRWLGIDATP
jgi:glycosidase